MADTRANPASPVPFGTPISTQHSAFLNLPLEIRDEIYGHVASDDPTTSRLIFDSQSDSTQHHSLLNTCKQTQQEYICALLRYPGITATIYNSDFTSFLAFLNRLPTAYLDILWDQSTSLEFASSAMKHPTAMTAEADVHLLISLTGDMHSALGKLEHWWRGQNLSDDEPMKTSRFLAVHRTPTDPTPTPFIQFLVHTASFAALEGC
jgi:hypothetical protein